MSCQGDHWIHPHHCLSITAFPYRTAARKFCVNKSSQKEASLPKLGPDYRVVAWRVYCLRLNTICYARNISNPVVPHLAVRAGVELVTGEVGRVARPGTQCRFLQPTYPIQTHASQYHYIWGKKLMNIFISFCGESGKPCSCWCK